MLGLLIIAVLFAALVYSGKVSQPAYAGKPHVGFMSKAKKQKLWHWYRTSGAQCVARREGWWTSNTGNGYYGRFQADLNFQSAYGRHYAKSVRYLARYGTANHWPRVLQIHMAKHGWAARGWYPWPNTAQVCGLL